MEQYSYKEMQQIIKRHSKDELFELIEQYIHDERDRKLLWRRLHDGISFEPLSVEFGLTARRCNDIVKECQTIIFEHLDL